MLAAQAIYGPHARDQLDIGDLALGRCLFRKLPEDVHDSQPLIGGGGRFVLVCDVRLDNRDDLIATLGIDHGIAATMADSAILLAAWEKWQAECFTHIFGDYALALWHRDARALLLARSPGGVRPLFYHISQGFVAVGSMAKGLHALAEIARQPDPDRIVDDLAMLPEHGSRSFFAGIQRVEPGHLVTISADGSASTRCHWRPNRAPIRLANRDAYAEALLEIFDAAVRVRLRGGGPAIGSHLSSGFDSAAVATSAAMQLAPSGGRVIAFTHVPRPGYDGPVPRHRHGDEGRIAAETAALYANIEHVPLAHQGGSPLAELDRNFHLFERPITNLCNQNWIVQINDAAQTRGLSVLLSGMLGNMTISYGGETLLPALVAQGRWLHWLREARALVRHGGYRPRGVAVASFGPFLPAFLWRWIQRAFAGNDTGLASYSALRPGHVAPEELEQRARSRAVDFHLRPRTDGVATRLWAINRIDLGTYHLGSLAGWGLDMRDPTIDHRLIDFMLGVPEEMLLSNGVTKALARHAFGPRLSPNVLASRTKGLQAVDWHEAMTAHRADLIAELARLGDCVPAAAAIDLPRLNRLVDNWPTGGWDTPAITKSYRMAMLRAISTGHFIRKASGSNA